MAEPLKIGVAGVGTVGAALVSQIAEQRDALTARLGRRIDVVAVTSAARLVEVICEASNLAR